MARVPLSIVPDNPSIPATPPDDYQHIQTSAASFGGLIGQAQEKAGGQTQQAGDKLAQVAEIHQDRFNELATTSALNQYQHGVLNLTGGDPSKPGDVGYLGQRGDAAIYGYNEAAKGLDDLRDTIHSGLQNDAQRVRFDQDARRYQWQTMESMRSHYVQQFKTYAAGLNNATQSIQDRDAAQYYDDDKKFFDAARTKASAAVSEVQDRYGDNAAPALKIDAISSSLAGIVKSRYEAWRANDPAGAFSWLQTGQMPNPFGTGMVPVRSILNGPELEQMTRQGRAEAERVADINYTRGLINGGHSSGNISDTIRQRATERGLDPSVPLTIARLESHLGATPDAPGNPHQGVFQLGPAEWSSVGGSDANRNDQTTQARLGTDWVAGAQKAASAALGRPAEGWETYIVHQQGTAGGADLLKAPPTQNAVDALAPAYKGNRAVATRAITGNGGRADMTVEQFLSVWQKNYADAGGAVGGANPIGASVQPVSTAPTEQRAPVDDAFPDESAIVQRVQREIPDPIRQGKIIADVRNQINTMRLATQTERDDLTHSLPDIQAAALDGREITIPEAKIRHLLPPAQAAREIENLNVAQSAGQVFKSIQWGSPAEITSAYQDLAGGLGPISTMIRSRTAQRAIGDTSNGPAPTPEQESPEAYRLRTNILRQFQQQVAKRQEALDSDPMSYVRSNPVVAQKGAAISPADPESLTNYWRAALSVQTSLGVPASQQHILTKSEAQTSAREIATADPATTDAGAHITQMARQYGSYWPRAFGDLKTLGGLPPSFQVLAMIPDPVVRSDFQGMLKTVTEKGGVTKLHDLAGKTNMADINGGIDQTMTPFVRSANIPGVYNNLDGIATIKDAVRNLASFYTVNGEASGSQALAKAFTGIIENKYDFDGYLRVPKGRMAPIENFADAMKSALVPADLAPIQGRPIPGIETSPNQAINERVRADVARPIQDQVAANAFREIQRSGKWVTNESDSGAFLIAQDRNGVPYQVRRANGARVEFNFGDAIKAVLPARRTPEPILAPWLAP